MNYADLVVIFEKWRTQHELNTYRYTSAILAEAKEVHHADWLKHPTASGDHEQSWRAFKGKNLEKLITHIIQREVRELGLEIIQGNTLERSQPNNLSDVLNQVRRNLLVRFGAQGEFGFHLPDIDIVIYNPSTSQVVAVVSSKVTLRERIAQTGYWKIKLSQDKTTKDIKVFFISPDEDGTLTKRSPMKKGRAIVETDIDGAYVMTEETIEASDKVKSLDQFISDLRKLINTA
ncbi:MAG: BsaWI family type II restriction enzyme [Chloroflexota bacterium]